MDNTVICQQSSKRALLPVRNKDWRQYIGQCLVGIALRANQESKSINSLHFTVTDGVISMAATDRQGSGGNAHQDIANLISSNFIEADNPIFADILRANHVAVCSNTGLTVTFAPEDGLSERDITDYLRETLPGYALNGISIKLHGEVLSPGAAYDATANEITVKGPDARGSTTFAVHNKQSEDHSVIVSRLGIPLFSVPALRDRTGVLDIVDTAGEDYFLPTSSAMISGLADAGPELPAKILSLNAKVVQAKGFDSSLKPIFCEGGLLNKLPEDVVANMSLEDTKTIIDYERGNAVYNLYPFHIKSALTDGIVGDTTPDKITVSKETMTLVDRWRFACRRANATRGIDGDDYSIGLTDAHSHVDRDADGKPIFFVGTEAADWSDQRMDAAAARHVTASLNLPLSDQLDAMTNIISEMSKDMTVMRMRNIMRETIGGDCLIFYTSAPESSSPVAQLIDFVWPEAALARSMPDVQQATAEPFNGEWQDGVWHDAANAPSITTPDEAVAPEVVDAQPEPEPPLPEEEPEQNEVEPPAQTELPIAPEPQESEPEAVVPQTEPDRQTDIESEGATIPKEESRNTAPSEPENDDQSTFSTDGIPSSFEDIFATIGKDDVAPPAPAEAEPEPVQSEERSVAPEDATPEAPEPEGLSDFESVLGEFDIGISDATEETPSLTVLDTVAIEESGRQAVKAIDLSRKPAIIEQEDEVTFSRDM